MTPLVIQGMQGLGDNIYQRAVLRELTRAAELYLETPWPQLYRDLPIRCVRPPPASGCWRLRTQTRNATSVPDDAWINPPANVATKRVHYASKGGTMLQGLCDAVGLQAPRLIFDAPRFDAADRTEPYIVVRPATIRTEWRADSRNPSPEYLGLAIERLRASFRIISVADLSPGAEWPVLPLPYADETYHAGELRVDELLALTAGAAGLVGGVGWIVPAAVAYGVPLFLIFGGQGGYNGPARLFDPRMDISQIHQAIPDRFCACTSSSHACDKRIANIEEQIERWAIRLAARSAPSMAAGAGHRVLPGDGAAVQRDLLGELSAAG